MHITLWSLLLAQEKSWNNNNKNLTEKGFKNEIYPLGDIFRQEVMAVRS